MQAEPEYTVSIASHAEQLERLLPLWDALNLNPNTQYDFFNLINGERNNIIRPQVLVLERHGAPVGLVVGRVVKQDFQCRFGYKSIKLASSREYHIISGGFLNCSGPLQSEAIFKALMAEIKKGYFDLLLISHLDVSSSLFKMIRWRSPFLCRDRLVRTKLHWTSKLPSSAAEVIQRLSKKRRHWVRSLEKQIEKDYPGLVSFRVFSDSTDLPRLLMDMEAIAKKTYQRGLGVGFINNEEYSKRLRFEADKSWMRAYILYLKDQPVAFWIGNIYKGVFYSGMTGYDPGYRKYGVGTLVFIRMIDSLCKETVEAIDFGLGDALYKQRFGDHSWSEANVRVFSPTFRGITLNLAQTIIEGSVFHLRSLLERTTLFQKLKTLWRHRLTNDEDE